MNKPKSRRVVTQPASQDDLINQLEQGTSVSQKSKSILEDMQTRDASTKSEIHDEPLFNSGAFFDLVLLEYIRPQLDNPRYLPIKSTQSGIASDLATLEDCVVCEKGILENRLNIDNPRYDEIKREIESIKDLANSIKQNGLVQPITVWRGNTTSYPIIAGHRRYYAICFLYGRLAKIRTKIFPDKPKNVNVLRHIENFARKDLSSADSIRSYHAAMKELNDDLVEITSAIKRKDFVTNILGISAPQYYRFEKLTEYYNDVLPLLDNGCLLTVESSRLDIIQLEKEGGKEKVIQYLNYLSSSRKHVTLEEYRLITNKDESVKPKVGARKKFIFLPKVDTSNSGAIFRLLKEDITKLDTGIDWDTIDKADAVEIERALKVVIEVLCKG